MGAVVALGSITAVGAHVWSNGLGTPDAASALVGAPVQTPAPAGGPTVASPDTATNAGTRLSWLLAPDAALDLSFGGAHRTLPQPELVALTTAQDGQPTGVDGAAVQALTARLAEQWNQSAQDARFAWNGGNLSPIRDSREGRVLDEAAAAAAISHALLAAERAVSLPGRIVPPAVSSDNPQALGIAANIDRASTSFAGSTAEKQYNIRLAAERLNGVVVPPGGTFSFNQEVGPTTLDSGYRWGFGIEAGASGARTVPSVAGGICQVATTLFHPVFWSGFPLVERHWHLYWIPAYTSRGVVGLDATVDEDSGLDFRWTNPTDGYILIQSATDEGHVYFGLYGKKLTWKVKVDEPEITNRVPPDPDPVAEAEPSLPWGRIQPVETAREGFDVAITRTVTREDGQPRPLTIKSSYEPSRTVTLVGTKDKPADADVAAVLARVAPPRAAPAAAASPAPVVLNEPVAGSPMPTAAGVASVTPTAGASAGAVTSPTPRPAAATAGPAPAVATATPRPTTPATHGPTATVTPTARAAQPSTTPRPR